MSDDQTADGLREKIKKPGLHTHGELWDWINQLDARCKAGDLPTDYCTWEGLLTILDTVYPESVLPTTCKRDEPDRDPGARIVSLLRWHDEKDKRIAALAAERGEHVSARKHLSDLVAKKNDRAERAEAGRDQAKRDRKTALIGNSKQHAENARLRAVVEKLIAASDPDVLVRDIPEVRRWACRKARAVLDAKEVGDA